MKTARRSCSVISARRSPTNLMWRRRRLWQRWRRSPTSLLQTMPPTTLTIWNLTRVAINQRMTRWTKSKCCRSSSKKPKRIQRSCMKTIQSWKTVMRTLDPVTTPIVLSKRMISSLELLGPLYRLIMINRLELSLSVSYLNQAEVRMKVDRLTVMVVKINLLRRITCQLHGKCMKRFLNI